MALKVSNSVGAWPATQNAARLNVRCAMPVKKLQIGFCIREKRVTYTTKSGSHLNMITQQDIHKAAQLLAEAAPGSTVMVFGSRARGEARADSDVDFMVIEPDVPSRRKEMARLLRGDC